LAVGGEMSKQDKDILENWLFVKLRFNFVKFVPSTLMLSGIIINSWTRIRVKLKEMLAWNIEIHKIPRGWVKYIKAG